MLADCKKYKSCKGEETNAPETLDCICGNIEINCDKDVYTRLLMVLDRSLDSSELILCIERL